MTTPLSTSTLLAELPRLRRYARVLTGNAERADKIVEETIGRARQPQDRSFCELPSAIALLALLRSIYLEQLSGEAQTVYLQSDASKATNPSARGAEARPGHADEVVAQLQRLPLEQREVLVLVAVERLSYEQIAGLLRAPVATVIARLSQARQALRASPSRPICTPRSAQ